jgi:PhnB protein
MTTKTDAPELTHLVRPIPDGYHAVTPFVIVSDSIQFTQFMKEAFGAEELFPPVKNEDGSVGHAEVRIGDSVVMMFDAKADWPPTPGFLRLYVEDCNATYQQALKAGASSVTRPTHVPWGDMVARVRDPLGNLWWIQTRIEDVGEEEIERRYGEKEFMDAMEYVQSAEFFPNRK